MERFKFNLLLAKNLILLYVFSVIIIFFKYSSPFVVVECFICALFSLSIFLFNIPFIRKNRIVSFFVFFSPNLIYFIYFINEIFTKETVTRWENRKGVLAEYTKTYYFYETNSGIVDFRLTCMGVYLVLQIVFWYLIIKKINRFNLE